MNSPAAVYVFRRLFWETIRQSLASRGFMLLLGLSGLCILLCLSVGVEGATAVRPAGEIELFGADKQPYTGLNRGEGRIDLAFGAIRAPMWRDAEGAVAFIEVLLALVGGGSVGILLLVLATGGFLPEFLQPSTASVLLAKPAPRWLLLTGKFAGVLAFVTLPVAFFIGGTWAALGFRTGVWHPGYLVCIPLFVLEFAVLFSCSALLAVWTRSAVLCIAGCLGLWAAFSAVNMARVAEVTGDASAVPAVVRGALEVAYWVVPKPVDLALLSADALDSERHFRAPVELTAYRASGAYQPGLSALTSVLFGAVVLALAARRLARTDY